MSGSDSEKFLERWSRRKREADTKGEAEGDAPADPGNSDEPAGEAADGAPRDRKSCAEAGPARPLTAADFADVNFEALDFDADYTRFMQAGVPREIRNKALRKLWSSNTVFTEMDGLDDYCGDYTDAARVLPAGMLKTSYKVGQGFLTDAEVAEWDALGKPQPAIETAKAGEAGEAGSELAAGETAPEAPAVADASAAESSGDAVPFEDVAGTQTSEPAAGDPAEPEPQRG